MTKNTLPEQEGFMKILIFDFSSKNVIQNLLNKYF